MKKIALAIAVAVIGLGVCGTDVCTAQTARPAPVRSCWAALDLKTQDIRRSALPYKGVDTTTLAVDMAKIYGRGFQVITWIHTAGDHDECSKAERSWFGDPA